MAKTLTARGTDGVVAIHEPGADLNNPLSNLQNIYFHSALDYLNVVRVVNATVDLPAVSSGITTLYNLFSHGMGRPCLLIARRTDTGQTLLGSTPVASSGSSFGVIAMCADSANVMLVFAGNYCYAQSIPLEIFVLDNPLF